MILSLDLGYLMTTGPSKDIQCQGGLPVSVLRISQLTVKVKLLWNITRCPLHQKGVELTINV